MVAAVRMVTMVRLYADAKAVMVFVGRRSGQGCGPHLSGHERCGCHIKRSLCGRVWARRMVENAGYMIRCNHYTILPSTPSSP